jgi:ElaB/YqjD/DUF883 family membrane-anchored ribosome-binding protein
MTTPSFASAHDSVHELLDDQLDGFKATVKKLVERATTKPNRLGRFINRTGETIEAHPLAAVGIALGIGYLVARAFRQ